MIFLVSREIFSIMYNLIFTIVGEGQQNLTILGNHDKSNVYICNIFPLGFTGFDHVSDQPSSYSDELVGVVVYFLSSILQCAKIYVCSFSFLSRIFLPNRNITIAGGGLQKLCLKILL